MPSASVDSRPHTVPRVLCILVVLIMVIAVIYAAWIGIGNFSRIGV